jgi:hypothetical protein
MQFNAFILIFGFILSSCNFTVVPASPKVKISQVSPQWLSKAGNETLVIKGSFESLNNVSITIGSSNCETMTIISSSEIHCLTPPHDIVENVKLTIKSSKKTLAEWNLKYVGVLGQPSTREVVHKSMGLSSPLMLRLINSKLYIGDAGNSRIVGYNDPSILIDRKFDFSLLNQSISSTGAAIEAQATVGARDLEYINGQAILTDHEGSRVFIYNGMPSPTNLIPKVVLGQPESLGRVINNGGVSARSLNRPYAARFIDGKLFVADFYNNRILVWNSMPTQNFQPADWVLGQPDFTTVTANTGGRSGASLSSPMSIDKIGSKFFVTDYGNGRVLVWNSVPASNTPADAVIGQASLTSFSASASATVLLSGGRLLYTGTSLILSDYTANRVLIYNNFNPENAIPSNLAADIVLGQPSFTSVSTYTAAGQITAQSLSRPLGLEVINGKLLVGDSGHNRLLVFDRIPTNTSSDQHLPAVTVIGQSDFSLTGGNRVKMPGPAWTPNPSTVTIYEGRILVNSESSMRVSAWNTQEPADFAPASFVLGQAGFTTSDLAANRTLASPTASTMAAPYQILEHNGWLYISDLSNHRILGWSTLFGSNGQAANIVLGQPSFSSQLTTPLSASSLNGPASLDVVDDHLVVSDRANNRMLIFNAVPTTGSVAANQVIGQANFTTNGTNRSSASVTGSGFNAPMSSASWRGRYVVSDHSNRRILLWSSFADFQAGAQPVSIFGQDNFTTIDAVSQGSNRMNSFGTTRVIDDVLYVPDPLNHRILVFDELPTGLIMKPTRVLGQPDLVSRNQSSKQALNAEVFDTPVGIFDLGPNLGISDYNNHRVLIVPK